MPSVRQNRLVPNNPKEYMHKEMKLTRSFLFIYLLSCFIFFLNSVFHEEMMKMRQAKLDYQVSRVSSFEIGGQLYWPWCWWSWLWILGRAMERRLGRRRLRWFPVKQCLEIVVAEPRLWAMARPECFEDVSNKTGLGFTITKNSLVSFFPRN